MRRVLLSPRWLALHTLAIALVVAFSGLGWWQLQRGFSGSLRSFGYALEWPVFALFVVIMWWRMARDAVRRHDVDVPVDADPGEGRRWEPPEVPRPAPDLEEPDGELAAYNRYLARLNAEAERRHA